MCSSNGRTRLCPEPAAVNVHRLTHLFTFFCGLYTHAAESGAWYAPTQAAENLHLASESDKWQYIWGSHIFSSRKAYKALIGTSQVHAVYKWL